MTEIEKIFAEIKEKTRLEVSYYREGSGGEGLPVCDRPFDGVADDGNNTFFRFLYKNTGYIGHVTLLRPAAGFFHSSIIAETNKKFKGFSARLSRFLF